MPLVHVRRVCKNFFQMVNIEYKNVTIKRTILKVNKSKHVQINLFYLVFNLFFPHVSILYPLKTSFSRNTKLEHVGIEIELNNIPFL